MNDLTLLSDTALDKQVEKVAERRKRMQTPEGKALHQKKMLEIIGVLAELGYKLSGDAELVARIWGDHLKEYVARIGYQGVRQAVNNWIDKDDSKYMIFPKVAWIADECKALGGDPIIEKGRRSYAEAVAKMEQEHREEIDRFKREHPKEWERISQEVDEHESCSIGRAADSRPSGEVQFANTDSGDKFYVSRR